MTNLLLVTSSPAGTQSQSRQLALGYIEELRRRDPKLNVVERALTPDDSPHFRIELMTALMKSADARSAAERDALAVSDAYVAEVLAADILVLAVPMHVFTIPSTLKAWFEQINRPGMTFVIENGQPSGLLGAKRAVIICTRGGSFAGPLAAFDFQRPLLQAMLGFFGLIQQQFVVAEGLGHPGESFHKPVDDARAELLRLAAV
jgi:FMN-dependent NADH-azoreductase